MRLKVILMAVLAVVITAVSVASASAALPEIKSTFPVTAEGSATGTNIGELSTALSAPISSSKVSLSTTFTKAGDQGTYTASFTGAEFQKESCNTKGDADGTILISSTDNLVVALNEAKTANVFGTLFQVPSEFAIECGPLGKPTIKITVEGAAIGAIEGVTEGTATSAFKGNLKCTKPNNGKQVQKEFKNEAGTFEKSILKANLGLGNESACEEVKEAVGLTTSHPVTFANIK